jgi:hypothetical protein
MLDGTIVKIVNLKKLAQRIMSYFVVNTLALAER